jgi:hypothetical protein
MPILGTCTVPGCTTVTIGPLCVAHDMIVRTTFVRGRPFRATTMPAPARPSVRLELANAQR